MWAWKNYEPIKKSGCQEKDGVERYSSQVLVYPCLSVEVSATEHNRPAFWKNDKALQKIGAINFVYVVYIDNVQSLLAQTEFGWNEPGKKMKNIRNMQAAVISPSWRGPTIGVTCPPSGKRN